MKSIKTIFYFVLIALCFVNCSSKPKPRNKCKDDFFYSTLRELSEAGICGLKQEADKYCKMWNDENIDCETLYEFYKSTFRKALDVKIKQNLDSIQKIKDDEYDRQMDILHNTFDSCDQIKDQINIDNEELSNKLEALSHTLDSFKVKK